MILGLILWKIKRIWQAIRAVASNPYVPFILAYTALFVVAFTTVANFGTLARERAMLLPLFFMLVAFLPGPAPDAQKVNAAEKVTEAANNG